MFAVGSAIASGMSTVVGKWNLMYVSPLLMNSIIFTVAAVLFTGYFTSFSRTRRQLRIDRKGWFWILLFTACSWFAVLATWAGIQKMDPSLASFINRLEVPIAVLLGIVLLRERLNFYEVGGFLLSFGGVVVMRLTLRMEYSEGFWLVLIGAIMFGLTELVSKVAVRFVDPLLLAYIRNSLLALGYWVVFLGLEGDFTGLEKAWPGVVALGVLGPILSRTNFLLALKRLELSKVAVISQAQTVVVLVLAWAFLTQLPAPRELIGGLFVVIGSLIVILARRRLPFLGNYRQPKQW
jgi:drug/metabolite transporter (DMT)-like permease